MGFVKSSNSIFRRTYMNFSSRFRKCSIIVGTLVARIGNLNGTPTCKSRRKRLCGTVHWERVSNRLDTAQSDSVNCKFMAAACRIARGTERKSRERKLFLMNKLRIYRERVVRKNIIPILLIYLLDINLTPISMIIRFSFR